MNSQAFYRSLWVLIPLVLATGLVLPPLMDNDAAEYAGVAMTMLQRNDWLTIVNRDHATGILTDYLDKPHMLFWSAMAGFKIFGVNPIGYRFFSLLLSLTAAFATARLGKHLYNKEVGRWAGLIFITAQAIMLANHDVRTDSLLTSFAIISIWQLILFVDTQQFKHLLFGFLVLALGVGTKGMIATITVGCLLFFYIAGRKDWKSLFNVNWLFGVIIFMFGLTPFLYAYYLQFDLHPEKFVNGAYGNSGIKFLLWSQSFERFAGDRGLTNSPEFSFFYHTILWAFLPWSIIMVSAVFTRFKELIQTRFNSFFKREQLTFIGVWVMFNIMSLSKFKLPHYLNILFPLLAIFTAAYLHELATKHKEIILKRMFIAQTVLISLLFIGVIIIITWAFPLTNVWIMLGAIVFVVFMILIITRINRSTDKLILFTVIGSLFVNFILNAQFYPSLGQYQSGNNMPTLIKQANLKNEEVFIYGKIVRSFDFYSGRFIPMVDSTAIIDKLKSGKPIYVFTPSDFSDQLAEQFPGAKPVLRCPDKHITRLKLSFLDPKKRMKDMPYSTLYKIEPQ